MNTYLKACGTSLIIAFLLSLSIPQNVFAKSSTVLGSSYSISQTEINAATTIASIITSYSSVAGYSAFNWYGAQTTANNIYTAAAGNNQLYSISFYHGHGDSEYVWNWAGWIWYYEQQWFILDNDGGLVYDKDIFSYASGMHSTFVLLWSCHQAETIGGTHLSGTPYGMPYAWLHTTSLGSDGYASPSGPYVFIGFDGYAPYLTNDELGATDAGYYFLQNFYYAALYQGYYYSVKDALDYAAQMVWGTSFANCIPYTGFDVGMMKIYGNGNNHISSYSGSGGCPLLYAFGGSEYTYECLLDIHDSSGADAVRNHVLTTALNPVNHTHICYASSNTR